MLWLYASTLLITYLASLVVYFRRLPGTPDAGLVASVVTAGLLEAAVFLAITLGLLGFGPLRQNRLRTVLYAVVVFAFTMTYLAQIYALWISNAFLSTLALENAQDAALSASTAQHVMVGIGTVAWLGMVVASWRGVSPRLSRRSLGAFAVIALVGSIGVGAFNRHAPATGDVALLARGQSPVGALLHVTNALRRTAEITAPALATTGDQSLCGVQLRGGRFPFLKQDINTQPLPVATLRPVAKPNVIMLFIEGESARLFEAYGGRFPGLTPNISRMAERAMVVDNYFSHTAATYRGLQGQLTSGYPLHGGADNGVGWTDGNAAGLARHSYASLPNMLHQRGYDTVFFSPHQPTEALSPFVRMLGFRDVYDSQRSSDELLKPAAPLFNSSLTDSDSYRALTAWLQARRGDTPFVIGLYSLGTHAFMDIPPGGLKYGDGSNLSLNTLHTLDAAFGAFYDAFMASKYADNTLLVLTVDHSHYPEPPFVKVAGSDFKPYFVDRVPLLVQAPWLSLSTRLDVHGRTTLDLAPTLLQLLGIQRSPNSFLGHSLFDRGHDRDFSIAAIGRSVYAIHDGNVYAPGEIPESIQAGYTRCKVLTETYYAHESVNTIFPGDVAPDASRNEPRTAHATPDARHETTPITVVASPKGQCAFDTVDGEVVKHGKPLTLSPNTPFVGGGWVVDEREHARSPFKLLLQGKQTYGFEGTTGVSRPDVARALHADSAANAGFNIVVDPTGVPAGTYEVMTLVKGDAGDEVCDTRKQVVIRQ